MPPNGTKRNAESVEDGAFSAVQRIEGSGGTDIEGIADEEFRDLRI